MENIRKTRRDVTRCGPQVAVNNVKAENRRNGNPNQCVMTQAV